MNIITLYTSKLHTVMVNLSSMTWVCIAIKNYCSKLHMETLLFILKLLSFNAMINFQYGHCSFFKLKNHLKLGDILSIVIFH